MKIILVIFSLLLITSCTTNGQNKTKPQKMEKKSQPKANKKKSLEKSFQAIHETPKPSIKDWILEQTKDWTDKEERKAVYFRILGSRLQGNKSYVSSSDVKILQESNGAKRRISISYEKMIPKRLIQAVIYYSLDEDAPGTYPIEAPSFFSYIESMSMDDYSASSKDTSPLEGEIEFMEIDDKQMKGIVTFSIPKLPEEGALAGKVVEEYEKVKVEIGFCAMQ